jgi:RecJ-like exonuclease
MKKQCDFCGVESELESYCELWLCHDCNQDGDVVECELCGKHIAAEESRESGLLIVCQDCLDEAEDLARDYARTIRETYDYLNSWLNNNR